MALTSVCALLGFFRNPPSTNDLGDIRYSILKPEVFESLNYGWTLLAGQPMEENWDLFKLLQSKNLLDDEEYKIIKDNLPDAEGVFLRGMEYRRKDGKGEPWSKRAVGEYESDAFKKHSHKYKKFDGNVVTDYSNDRDQRSANFGSIKNDSTDQAGESDNETRPRNITVYIYIKVKN